MSIFEAHNRHCIIFYEYYVQSIMLYGAETWTIDHKHKGKLLATEMDFWRRSSRKSRKDRVRNSTIRDIMEVRKDIVEVIEEKRLSWFGHVKRMEDSRIPKRILEWHAEGRRGRGRPKERWMNGVQQSMNRRNLKEDDAMDREIWRRRIHLTEG